MSEDFFEEKYYGNGAPEETSADVSYKSTQGERRLLKAILQKAVDDIEDNDEKVRAEVQEWFSEEYSEEGGEVYSLQYICDYLDFDFEHVQQFAFKLLSKR